jgi:hypothetical protein
LSRRILNGRPSGKMRLVGLHSKRRVIVKEKRAIKELIAEENMIMMMNPNGMDEFTREWWELTRMEILQYRRQDLGGGGRAPSSGGATSASCDGRVPPDDGFVPPVDFFSKRGRSQPLHQLMHTANY